MQFVYYEPQASGWELRDMGLGGPNDEVIFHGHNYAVTVSAMTLARNIKSVGPPLLPVVPVNGANDLAGSYKPGTISIYMRFFLQTEANVDFSRIKLRQDDQLISVHTIYKLSYSSLEEKKHVDAAQTITGASKYEREHGQFPEYQLIFVWADEKPESFSVIIPTNVIRIDGESVPATVINFKRKSVSKYQYFP